MRRHKIESITFENLCFGYEGQKLIFDNLNFDFPLNNIISLSGATGGGKNTLLKILCGLVTPTQGKFLINGNEVQNLSYHEFDEYRLSMGYSFDVGGLINNQSLYENFKLVLDFHDYMGEGLKREYVIGLLGVLGLQDLTHLRPAMISSGARKAASVLRAFILNPEVVILNNPTLGLNIEQVKPLCDFIKLHMEKRNLKHLFISSDDQNFLSQFSYNTIKVSNNKLEFFEKEKFKMVG